MIQWRKKHHSFHLENVWYVIHDRKSDVEHRTCIYFIPSWKSNLSSIIFKKFSFESNVHFHYPNSAQAVQRLSSELHDQDQAGRYCQQSAFGRKPAVSFESGFELPPQAAVRGNASSSRRNADFFVVCCSRRRFLSKHILLTHEHVHFAHRWRAFRVRNNPRILPWSGSLNATSIQVVLQVFCRAISEELSFTSAFFASVV